MRTRIARDAARAAAGSVHTFTSKKQPFHRARRMAVPGLVVFALVGVALIAAAVSAAAALGATTPRADYRYRFARYAALASVTTGEGGAGSALAVRERMFSGMRWLEDWEAAHRPPLPPAPPPPAPPPPAAPAPAPPPPPAPVLTDATSTTTPDWACIRLHESGDRFNSPTAPGGAYGFLEGTWLSLGYSGWPYEASPAVQSQAALFLYNELGWQPWSTRYVCGL
jgi:hypothetical protein